MRDVHIEPQSTWAELVLVLQAALVVVVAVGCYLAWDSPAILHRSSATRYLLPFQALIENRSSDEQRLFGELQEGLLEAEIQRSQTGAWPSVDALAQNGIPPFAWDPTAKGANYRWGMLRSGAVVNYLGLPDQPEASAWLVLIQEPEPGAPEPAREDEEHHRLIDGTMLRISTWTHPHGTRIADRLERVPQADGWTQLYAVGPSLAGK